MFVLPTPELPTNTTFISKAPSESRWLSPPRSGFLLSNIILTGDAKNNKKKKIHNRFFFFFVISKKKWINKRIVLGKENTNMAADSSSSGAYSTVISTRFNQDFTRFTVGTQTGFRVYRIEPLSLCYAREPLGSPGGGIAIAEVLGGTNIVALVGGGPSPRWPNNLVVLFDDHSGKKIAKYQAAQCILSVKLTQTLMVVVTERRITFLDFSRELQQLRALDTTLNPLGLLSLSYQQVFDPSMPAYLPMFACPGAFEKEMAIGSCAALDSVRTRQNVTNHALSAIAISYAGDLVAVASEQGTIVRVWKTAGSFDGTAKPDEFRRGNTPVQVLDLAFETFEGQARFVLMATDTETIHIFSLVPTLVPNAFWKMDVFGLMTLPWPCFEITCKIPLPRRVTFGVSEAERITVVVIGVDGSYAKYVLNITAKALVLVATPISENFLHA